MLQWMPSRSSTSAAWMPSQVDASLMSTRSRDVPAASYWPMSVWAFSMERGMSYESRASTSVETRPAMISRILRPNSTLSRSMALRTTASLFPSAPASFLAQASAESTIGEYSAICAAAMSSDGLVVAS